MRKKKIKNFTERLGFCETHGFVVNNYPTGVVSFMPFSSCGCGFSTTDVKSLKEAIKIAGKRKHYKWFKKVQWKNILVFLCKI